MRLQPAWVLTEDTNGKKRAIRSRARLVKKGRIEKRNKASMRKAG